MTLLEAALDAGRRGFWIFPVARGQKIPHPAAGKWGETATNDYWQILHFWTNVDPYANIGVACKPSQLLVVDLDQAKEGYKLRGTEYEYLHSAYGELVHGTDVIDEMAYKLTGEDEDADSYLNTFTVQTGSGGRHLYYRWPEHWPTISQASPVKGIVDVRGNGGQYGGYVLGAGSETDAGVYHVIEQLAVELPPKWIRRLVAEKPQPPKIKRPPRYAQPGSVSHSGLVDTVRNAGEGNRNNSLLWSARTMCEEGATEQQALDILGPAAEQAGLDYREIERTIQSAYRTQRQKMG